MMKFRKKDFIVQFISFVNLSHEFRLIFDHIILSFFFNFDLNLYNT
jgi:hypothetical protein